MESEPCSEDPVETASDESPPQLNPSSRVKLNHPLDQVLGNVTEPMMTHRQMRNQVSQVSQSACEWFFITCPSVLFFSGHARQKCA
ncbi:hypothetical protein U1Q18_036770 [Sarracenia purpurea var. burkii]